MSMPKLVPRWAWKLLAWENNSQGAQPKAPTPLPRWYGIRKRWRQHPFALAA